MVLHRFIFFILLFLLPAQLGYHFWPKFSYVYGLRVDYLSPTIYLTDILIFLISIFWFFEKRRKFSINNLKIIAQNFWFVFLVFFFLFLNCYFSENKGAAFYKLFKVLEFIFLGFYTSREKIDLSFITYFLGITITWTSLIAIAQFIKQSSLGGMFWFLGERTFSVDTPGIAKITIDGKLLLRPYATFSHPNSMAGYVFVSILLILAKKKLILFDKFSIFIGIISLILSFSRVVWLVAILLGIVNIFSFIFKKYGKEGPTKSNIFLLFFLPLLALERKIVSVESISRRIDLNRIALKILRTSLYFGVGLNNFISKLSKTSWNTDWIYFLQPVHNIFLLIATEIGLVGLFLFLSFLFLTFKRIVEKPHFLYPILAIFLTGMFDHYWLTLQQNCCLLAITFGLIWRK